MKRFSEIILVIAIVIISAVISFSVIAGLTWLVCLGFSFEWSWQLSLGVWALIMLIASAINMIKG